MSWSVSLKNPARKAFLVLEQNWKNRITAEINNLADNPLPKGVRKLKGIRNTYSLRLGSHRIVYLLDKISTSVTILKIGDRKEIYRRFGL